MAATSSSLRSRVRRVVFGSAAALTRLDPTGRVEQRFQSGLTGRLKGAQLQSLAWHAEERGDIVLAFAAWRKLAGSDLRKGKLRPAKVYGKLAALETRMRRQVAFYDPQAAIDVGDAPQVPQSAAHFATQPHPGPRALRQQRAAVVAFWEWVGGLSEPQQAQLRKAYGALSAHRNRARRSHVALAALQPILAKWPEYQTAYPQFYKAAMQSLLTALEAADKDRSGQEGVEDAWAQLERWWLFFEARAPLLNDPVRSQIWSMSLRFAQKLEDQGHLDAAERVMLPCLAHWQDNAPALPVLARAAEARGDLRGAAGHWQLYAAIMNPVSTKSGTIKADNAKERARRANFGRTALRGVRARLALEALEDGRKREFRELTCRVIESLPDQRLLKYDPTLLDMARHYVQQALREDGAFVSPVAGPEAGPETAPAPAPLRRVVLALDILKVSEVHTHSRVIFTMCRNLLRHDRDLEIHVVITNERFAVTTPVVSPAFNPSRDAEIEERARAALGDLFGARFHLRNCHAPGLEGVVEAAKHILGLGPDLVLYGGGHRGLFSNESRLVRHVLFDLLPAAFFYIQANNQVDPKFDMIIARGPHAIEGDPGAAAVREQPYPTIVDDALAAAQQEIDPGKAQSRVIVSAITGVRMDVRLSEMTSDEMAGFFSILDRVEGAVWHFIGCRDIAAVRRANPEIARRMDAGQIALHCVMPFEEFTDLVGNAALFLHLPGFTGGSGGAAVARRGAVPILTFNHSDVSGRQPPETVFETDNIAGFGDLAVSLLEDSARWREVAQAQIDHTQWIRETSVQGFHGCLSEAADLGRARIAAAGVAGAQEA